jgi:hypothetical protein
VPASVRTSPKRQRRVHPSPKRKRGPGSEPERQRGAQTAEERPLRAGGVRVPYWKHASRIRAGQVGRGAVPEVAVDWRSLAEEGHQASAVSSQPVRSGTALARPSVAADRNAGGCAAYRALPRTSRIGACRSFPPIFLSPHFRPSFVYRTPGNHSRKKHRDYDEYDVGELAGAHTW